MPEHTVSILRRRLASELERWRDEAQLRALESLAGIDLCSNDYLGLAADPRLKRATVEAVARARTVGSTGSRLLSGNAREWEQLEFEFASFAGTEAALYFGSGYAANTGLLGAILRPGDIVFSDALNHASLVDGMRLSRAVKVIYPHGDLDFLERALREHSGYPGAKLIVTESVFSMEGDVAPLESLGRLAREYGAVLIVDEAHATGVMGPLGRGVAAEVGIVEDALAIVHTCGKALASAGAFVCCGEALKQYLVNRARTFVFSTAMPPYLAGQIRAALGLAKKADDRRAHLRSVASLLRRELIARGIAFGLSATHIVPVFCGSNDAALHVASGLQANGFAVRAIRPPTVPAGTARIRLSLNAKIGTEDVRRLADAIGSVWDSLRVQPASLHA
jgi:8-amino-7-oxononanoate synthase